jgi:hypothetical protein
VIACSCKSARCVGINALVILAACASASAQEKAKDVTLREQWQKTYQTIAESISMRHGEMPLTLLDQPLLFYTNPVRTNDQHGAIFLWTSDSRPAVIASIWSATNRNNPDSRIVTHEWHSLLAESHVTATRDGKRVWTLNEPGVVWETPTGAPAPAGQRAARLLQMRSLARRFSVGIQVEGESDLRLMVQPLYRYPETTTGALDGAIFAFAMTTDPELLVLLEDRDISGQPCWYCSKIEIFPASRRGRSPSLALAIKP